MTQQRLSLAGKLTVFFAVGTLLIVIVNAISTAYFLRSSIEEELAKVVEGELTETQLNFSGASKDEFKALVTNRMAVLRDLDAAWRVWNTNTGAEWDTFGLVRLADEAGPSVKDLGHTRFSGKLVWRSELQRSGYTVAVVVDGTPRYDLLEKYEERAALRVIISGVCAAVISWLFLRRVSGILRRVTEDLRAETTGDPRIELANPPQEILALAEALRERLARVRAASEQAQLFTASLAHELRSPIQNLIGETEVALIAPRNAATYRAVLESNLHELRELGDAVDNLLTICASRGSDSKVLREEFDLADEAEIRLARERSRARLLDVELEIRRNGDTRLVGDREALMRALRNLAGNAIDFSPPGSRVTVTLDGASERVRVTVDDCGPGVPEELRAKIFEPFFTGPAKRGGRVGYGLGLAIARTAVIGQGGTIEVVDNAERGASFRLELPRRPMRPTNAA
ncbi:MAG: hypothetical protein IT453_21195 [Planctomycetes bacterium]|nr:hypothetical protein [Planctomycetota bacterium]